MKEKRKGEGQNRIGHDRLGQYWTAGTGQNWIVNVKAGLRQNETAQDRPGEEESDRK